jgi:hypothetical protein
MPQLGMIQFARLAAGVVSTKPLVSIRWIETDPLERGKGIASALMDKPGRGELQRRARAHPGHGGRGGILRAYDRKREPEAGQRPTPPWMKISPHEGVGYRLAAVLTGIVVMFTDPRLRPAVRAGHFHIRHSVAPFRRASSRAARVAAEPPADSTQAIGHLL